MYENSFSVRHFPPLLFSGSFFWEIRQEKLSGEEQANALRTGCAVLVTPMSPLVSVFGAVSCEGEQCRGGVMSSVLPPVGGLLAFPAPWGAPSPLPDSLCGPLLRQESQG